MVRQRLAAYLRSIVGRPSVITGSVDAVNDQRVAGWVRDPSRPDRRLTVSVAIAGELVGSTEASIPRPDLLEAGIGDGRFGFDFKFGRVLSPAEVDAISLATEGAPLTIRPGLRRSLSAATVGAGGSRGPYRSRFGGLWTDRDDAKLVLAGKHRDGAITDQEAEYLSKWIDDGYVVLRSAIESRLVEAVRRDIDRAYRGELGLLFREILTDGGIALVPITERYGSETNIRAARGAGSGVAAGDGHATFVNIGRDTEAPVLCAEPPGMQQSAGCASAPLARLLQKSAPVADRGHATRSPSRRPRGGDEGRQRARRRAGRNGKR
jgi:hypothetical protein